LKVTTAEATYLAWVDCSAAAPSSAPFARRLRESLGLWTQRGPAAPLIETGGTSATH